MATLLSATGELSYNGVVFDYLTTTKMRGTPVYDDAGRTVKWVEWTLEVTGTIGAGLAAGTSTDDTLDDMRTRLTQPRGTLIYADKGFGTFQINQAPVFDVNWGPKPELMEYVPVGSNQTARVVWKVKCCIPECNSATYRRALVMACYDISHDFDDDGYLTATISGAIEIPLTAFSNVRTVSDTVDKYREMVHYQPAPGFKRKSFKWQVSKDRRRAEFSFVDEEIPHPLPLHCTHCDVKHKVRNSHDAKGFVIWENEMMGSFRISPLHSPSLALIRFIEICWKRIRHAKGSFGRGPGPDGGTKLIPLFVLFHTFEVEEDVFGKESKFRAAWTVFGSDLRRAIAHSGMWLPVDGTDFIAWGNSIATSMGPRGHAKVTIDPKKDTLVDLCLKRAPRDFISTPIKKAPTVLTLPRLPIEEIPPPTRRLGRAEAEGGGGPGLLETLILGPVSLVSRLIISPDEDVNEDDTQQAPFMVWSCELQYLQDNHVVRHKPLAGEVKERGVLDVTGPYTAFDRAARASPAIRGKGAVDILQQQNRPSVDVALVGFAYRVHQRVPTPELRSLDGKAVKESRRDVRESVVGRYGGAVIYKKVWRIDYLAEDTPAKIPLPANPMLQVSGQRTGQ